MTDNLERIEQHLRTGEVLDSDANLVVRGWPLTVEGLLQNADATRSRFSRRGEPFVAVSAEVTIGSYTLDALLSGPRLRTRSRYAAVPVAHLIDVGFDLVPTFGLPHYSVDLGEYAVERAERLLEVLGDALPNPHHVRRQT